MSDASPPAVSRRAVLGAALATPLAAGAARPRPAPGPYDAIVVGAGSAGLPAALHAAERGRRVLVLEAAGEIGGTLHRSSGQIAAAGTLLQRELGIEDSVDAHFAEMVRISHGTLDHALVRRVAEEAPGTLDWLHGLGFRPLPGHPVTGDYHEHFVVRRYLWGKDGGKSILAVLEPPFARAVRDGKIDLRLGTRAVELAVDDAGRVVGVTAERADGTRETHRGAKVLLASGGCAANPALYQRLHGVPLHVNWAYPKSLGDGLALAEGLGARLQGGEMYLPTFGIVPKTLAPATAIGGAPQTDPGRRKPWEIYVNAAGERFVREDEPSVDRRERALARQFQHRFWIVFDDAILAQAPPLLAGWTAERLRAGANSAEWPAIVSAATLPALAAAAGIDAVGLEGAVRRYNAGLGALDPFGREHRPMPLERAPWYAVRVQGWTPISFAGLACDADLRVLKRDGRPIPNLYAAGEVLGAGATCGNAYVNGMTLTPALALGRWFGRTVA